MMNRRSLLPVLLAPLCLWGAAAAQQGGKLKPVPDLAELVARPQSEMAIVLKRHEADRGNLTRLYTIPSSPTRLARLKEFAAAWLSALDKLDVDRLSEPARADYRTLRKTLEGELRQLDTQARADAEAAPLVPFAPVIIELEESRRKLEKVNGGRAAGLLIEMKKQLVRTRQEIEATLKGEAKSPLPLSKALAERAADTTASLRTALKNWHAFYHGYDPVFTWWIGDSYKEVDQALQGYAAFLREKAPKAGDGKALKPPAPRREVTLPPRAADVPDLRELMALPRSEMAAVVQRYQAERGGKGKGGFGKGAPPTPDRSAQQKKRAGEWLAALEKLDFDQLSQEGKVDYLLLRNQIERELRRIDLAAGSAGETERLLPFARIVDDVEEARKDKDAAAKVVALLKDLQGRVAQAQADVKAGKLTAGSTSVQGALKTLEATRADLRGWFGEGKVADPKLEALVRAPYKSADGALESYAAALRSLLPPGKVRDQSGITGTPIGRAALLNELAAEMISYSPEELIAIAEKELAWCQAELKKASRELGFGDDWQKAIEKVKTLHVEPGQQPALIRDLAREATAYLHKHGLLTIPPIAEETWRMEMMSPQRQLVNPFFTGGEVITVSFPTDTMSHEAKLQSMRGNNIHFSRATVHHELIPGHHLQGYMTARHSTHRRAFGTPFWLEGWALYWELLLYERGFPKTPEDRVGFLFWRSHRCARIIFSLGFHLGKMSPQECIDLLVDRVGHERNNATAEVRRSFAGGYGPLYQAAYLLGGLQIRGLRKELVDSGKMADREFHDRILRAGSMPIAMVRALLTNERLTRDHKAEWRFHGAEPAARAVTVGPVPKEVRERLKLSPFYKKHADAGGLPVLSSEKVADAALIEAVYLLDRMLDGREDIRKAIIKNRVRVAVMSPTEQTTDIPEHSDLTPKDYWDNRARGLGATRQRPAVSCGEENLLNLKGDRYRNENILIHEFAHVIHQMGMNSIDPTFDKRLRQTYARAKEKGLWAKTYAMENHSEYWAEGVQSYFDCNAPTGGVHNGINTREKLAKYDPELFKLIDEVFQQSPFRYVRYDRRKATTGKAKAASDEPGPAPYDERVLRIQLPAVALFPRE